MNKDIFSLDNKVVIITGAAGLLGKQHADAVASFGGTPILIDIAEGPLKKLERELNHKYAIDSIGYVVNISNEEEIQQNYNAIIKRFPKIDALVNNAANNPKFEDNSVKNFSRLENFPINDWDSDLSVGLTGAFHSLSMSDPCCSTALGHAGATLTTRATEATSSPVPLTGCRFDKRSKTRLLPYRPIFCCLLITLRINIDEDSFQWSSFENASPRARRRTTHGLDFETTFLQYDGQIIDNLGLDFSVLGA